MTITQVFHLEGLALGKESLDDCAHLSNIFAFSPNFCPNPCDILYIASSILTLNTHNYRTFLIASGFDGCIRYVGRVLCNEYCTVGRGPISYR